MTLIQGQLIYSNTHRLFLYVCVCVSVLGVRMKFQRCLHYFTSLIPSFIWIPGVPLGIASCSDTQPPWSLLFPLVPHAMAPQS